MIEKPFAPKRRSRAAREERPLEAEQPAEERYTAYAQRDGEWEGAESAFAPPPKLEALGYESQLDPAGEEAPRGHVYHPREATWAEERQEALAASELGYQVREDTHVRKQKRRHPVRMALLAALGVCLACGAVLAGYEPLLALLNGQEGSSVDTQEPFTVMVTPEPIRAYDAPPPVEIADSARAAIASLSGTLQMDAYIVTDTHVVMRHERSNGRYDFYLYSAPEGRLLCYFEGLGERDMIPQEDGTFFVNQPPYLVASNGSALLRVSDLEEQRNESLRLHPLFHGWAVIEGAKELNYINRAGQLLSPLWFSRVFPFTGDCTLAYVDTGSATETNGRYLLYVLGEDGTMTRWLSAKDEQDVIASVCGMAYMRGGDLYQLPEVAEPILNARSIDAYPDCDALVAQDPQTGKYGLLVHGELHYDFVYDSIFPMESDIRWQEKTLTDGENRMTVHTVSSGYPQPLSHAFVLERDGQREYVALSAQSTYPIRLEEMFETEEPV